MGTIFVTGGTGFIGRFVLLELLDRGHEVVALARSTAKEKQARINELASGRPGSLRWVTGDITRRGLISRRQLRDEIGREVSDIVHLAAVYDMNVDDDRAEQINVTGTANVVALANQWGARLHHVSSIAVAGDFRGVFREDMFDVGQKHNHPYLRTKFLSEKLVREQAAVPYRVYRPGIVIGSSETGEADRIDGPYYFFKLIQRMRALLPQWVPLVGIETGHLQFAPVDFVARAIAALATTEGLDGETFHLLESRSYSIAEAANIFCRAAHAPELAMRIDGSITRLVPPGIRQIAANLPLLRQLRGEIAKSLGVPESMLQPGALLDAEFDTALTERALRPLGIECPPLESYAWKVWDYWERQLDASLNRPRTLAEQLGGKVVLLTGASSGIGRATALALARSGATLLLVARGAEALQEVADEVEKQGGTAEAWPCDLTDLDAIDQLVAEVLARHGAVDVLVNNAGKSIRRSVVESLDRFHDFQRTMQLNYFAAVRLTTGLLPAMMQQKSGHIVNISSIGVQTNAPRFSAYVASKAALDAFSRCLAVETLAENISVTTVYMPLVRTPMIAPTRIYEAFPALTPEQAAELVVRAITERPKRVATRLGTFAEISYALAPRMVEFIQNVGFRLFPSNTGSGSGQPLSVESVAFAHLMRGVHF